MTHTMETPPAGELDLAKLSLEQLLICHECDLLMAKPHLQDGEKAECPRCGYEVDRHQPHMVQRSLALVLAALIFYLPANFMPIMSLGLLGQKNDDTIWSAVKALYLSDMAVIALIVFLSSMLIPLIKLLTQLWVLLILQLNGSARFGLWLYRTYHHMREWGMLEVYMFGVLVSIVKMIDLGDLSLGLGLACFVGLLVSQIWLEATMNDHQVWEMLEEQRNRQAVDEVIDEACA
ncbi:paraquat-inducible protein A [Atopomonas sediminilitoris]|uniref:paraquat-inducible protein A n=1 Tax=Atopomonas sediminilitoris TaxID=2919919 RepID=UPI001F4E328D|nr:paraquat-inducible protein A [Atopomonas sediminilitoris]MCJ8168763.1 paraquat-inducible protein A [Atopomonas sediminilitoris]